jgi:hypothetical protein
MGLSFRVLGIEDHCLLGCDTTVVLYKFIDVSKESTASICRVKRVKEVASRVLLVCLHSLLFNPEADCCLCDLTVHAFSSVYNGTHFFIFDDKKLSSTHKNVSVVGSIKMCCLEMALCGRNI